MVVGDSSTVGENSLKYSVKICARFLMVIIMLILSARSKQLKISERIIDVDLKQIYTSNSYKGCKTYPMASILLEVWFPSCAIDPLR